MKKYIFIILLLTICVIIFYKPTNHTFEETTYVVSRGDTLWSIAQQFCPEDMDTREYIYKLNISPDLQPGQTITILREVK